MRQKKAFTLIELLVVISIIALLVSILVPSLNQAREQARVLSCMVNSKQIGTIIALYQADNAQAVPVLLNRDACDPYWGFHPAKSAFLSIALRSYSEETKQLPTASDPDSNGDSFDPEDQWGPFVGNQVAQDHYLRYVNNYLPQHYSCPFVRGKSPAAMNSTGTVTLSGVNGTQTYSGWVWSGKGGSYNTWVWGVDRNATYTVNHPYGPPHGRPKYGATSWHKAWELGVNAVTEYNKIKNQPVKRSKQHAERVGAADLSEMTVVYCEQGQNDNWSGASGYDFGIYNYGSHRKGQYGGTIAIFADTHVEWVPGTQIGWP